MGYTASELSALLTRHRFHTEIFGTFPVSRQSTRSSVISLLKRMAIALHLIPKTMKSKEFLKRLFWGSLVSPPSEVYEGMTEYNPPYPIPIVGSCPEFKVLYAVGRIA